MSSDTRQTVLNNALRLSPEDRAAVARALLESIHEEIDPSIDAEWRAELRRRLDAFDRGKSRTIPEDEVRRRAAERLRKSDEAA